MMEAKGSVNQYVPGAKPLVPVFTIHLAAGTTPFLISVGGYQYASNFFRLTRQPLVTHGFYRPRDEEFAKCPPEVQEHVLDGGLLVAELSAAAAGQVEGDPATGATTPEEFGDWCLKTYGRPAARAKIREGGSARPHGADGGDLPG